MRIHEGYMPFLGHKTYYRIAGTCTENRKPLVLLHGGPGSTHNYMELFDPLAECGRAVISYDQIGCGNSYLDGHPELWRQETWLDELSALRDYLKLDELHLLGQSWGGMLAIAYLSDRQPDGVRSVTLSSTLPSSALWAAEQHRMIARDLSEAEQAAIARAEQTGCFTDPAYLAANARYMELHCCGTPAPDAPECLRRPCKTGTEAYLYGWGPNEYTPTGSLRNFDYLDAMKKWTLPTLIVSGSEDLCTPTIAAAMQQAVSGSRRELFTGCRHMCFAEDTPRYLSLMETWLASWD